MKKGKFIALAVVVVIVLICAVSIYRWGSYNVACGYVGNSTRSWQDTVNKFRKLGNYKESKQIVDIYQLLVDSKYADATSAYLAYRESGGELITVDDWFMDIKTVGNFAQDGFDYLSFFYTSYIPTLRLYLEEHDYCYDYSKMLRIIGDQDTRILTDFGSDKVTALCGSDPDGKVIVNFQNASEDDAIPPGMSTLLNVCLPEDRAPQMLSGVEYVISLDCWYSFTSYYSDGGLHAVKGYAFNAHASVLHCPDGSVVYDIEDDLTSYPAEHVSVVSLNENIYAPTPSYEEFSTLVDEALAWIENGTRTSDNSAV